MGGSPHQCTCAALQSSLGLDTSIEIGRFDAYAASLYEAGAGVPNGPGSFMLQVTLADTSYAIVV